MNLRLVCLLLVVLLPQYPLLGQTTSQPFASLERAVRADRAGWAGDKSKLSAAFDADRRQLGDKFESELLKWLGDDVERHYWISGFLKHDSYLHGNKRLPQLALLVMEQGLSLVRQKTDQESRGYVVRLSISSAKLSDELGFASLATSHKNEAEALLKEDSGLSVYVPGMSEADRQRYRNIPSRFPPPTVITDTNPPPKAQVSGGVLNGRALKMVKPAYPSEAHKAGASGTVEVKVVFDEAGKVIWARATSGHPLLRKACEDAAWQTTFQPTAISGKPVKVIGIVLYNFVE
jgi:TonB family protein